MIPRALVVAGFVALVGITCVASGAAAGVASATADPDRVQGTLENSSNAQAMIVRADGRILTAGITRPCLAECGDASLAISRFSADGAPDPQFGDGDGIATIGLGGANGYVAGFAIQPDDRIVVAAAGAFDSASASYGVLLTRLEASGETDLGFGQGGRAFLPSSLLVPGGPHALAVDGQGRILIAGSTPATPFGSFAVARFLGDGTLDGSFGNAGVASLRVDPNDNGEVGRSVTVAPDGTIVLSGVIKLHTLGTETALVELTPDGDLDPAFGSGSGATSFPWIPGNPAASSSTSESFVKESGQILVIGTGAGPLHPCDIPFVAAVDAAGQLDPAYADQGIEQSGIPFCASPTDGVLGADGALTISAGATQSALLRFEPSGEPDLAFGGGDGYFTHRIGGLHTSSVALAVLPSGEVLAAGSVESKHCSEAGIGEAAHPPWFRCFALALTRFTPDGRLTPAFGRGGIVTEPVVHFCDQAPSALCGVDLGERDLRKLVRRRFPDRLRLTAHGLNARVSCDRLIDRPCKVELEASRSRTDDPLAKASAVEVKAGSARLIKLALSPEEIDQVANAGRVYVRESVSIRGRKTTHVDDYVKLTRR